MRSKRRLYFSTGLVLVLSTFLGSLSVEAQRAADALAWPPVTKQTRPWTRWWWLGSIVNERDLTVEMEKYRRVGLGGLEITPIYGVKGEEAKFLRYLSPEWASMLEHTLREAGRLDLGVDLATGTGWPFGGPWVGEEDSAKYFAHKSWTLKGGERLNESIAQVQKPLVRAIGRRIRPAEISTVLKDPIGATENLHALAIDQVRFEKPLPLQTLMAFRGSAAGAGERRPLSRSLQGEAAVPQTIDLTARVGRDGRLDWVAPAGEWTLIAIFQGWHGKQVERAAPGGEGNVIDHFSARSLGNYLRRLDQSLAGRDLRGLRAWFNDSYEVDDADGQATWTPNLPAEFARRRGYDLRNHLPALLGRAAPEENARVLCDFRETISDLLLDEFTVPWQRWAAAQGKIVRNQSHGAPANILDLYAASDIPETEGQEILRMKFATSAANVTGKRLTSAEAATWLNEHTMATLGEVKQAADRFFLGGVNHLCYHGTPFSPESVEWPGYLFYAAVHFGPTNPFFEDFAALNGYVTRCQSFLQSGRPDNDLLLYYPIHDDWMTAPPVSRGPLQHYGGGIESGLGQSQGQMLLDAGHTYDLISDRQLQGVTVSGGTLRTGGGAYKAVVLPEVRYIPEPTLARLLDLARRGASVIVERRLPTDAPGLDRVEARRKSIASLTAQLAFGPAQAAGIRVARMGAGRVLLGDDLKSLLAYAGIAREPMAAQGLQFLRRTESAGPVYFVVNSSSQTIDGWVGLRTNAKSVAIFDPMRETKGLAALRRSAVGASEVYLQLAPGESRVLKTFSHDVKAAPVAYLRPIGAPQPLAGRWSVRFTRGGPELPAPVETDSLRSWTEFGGDSVRRFAGTATYTLRFPTPAQADAAGWLLDLGRVADSARVTLNGRELGVLLGAPFQLRIAKEELRAENVLEIAVSNSMTNRIIDLDRRGVVWKRFYNVNMPSKRKENAGADGLFNAASWPLRESGLLGPVRLLPVALTVP
ncbi:MAG: glycosyl hydrolase [Blastocatellia bacterium]|nr:glycosyl hydrolase [Blastocatellia bacterium]